MSPSKLANSKTAGYQTFCLMSQHLPSTLATAFTKNVPLQMLYVMQLINGLCTRKVGVEKAQFRHQLRNHIPELTSPPYIFLKPQNPLKCIYNIFYLQYHESIKEQANCFLKNL